MREGVTGFLRTWKNLVSVEPSSCDCRKSRDESITVDSSGSYKYYELLESNDKGHVKWREKIGAYIVAWVEGKREFSQSAFVLAANECVGISFTGRQQAYHGGFPYRI